MKKGRANVARSTLVAASTACLIVLWPADTNAQDSAPAMGPAVGVIIAGIVSIHPPGYHGQGGPYLDRALGGAVPGVSVAIGLTSQAGLHLTVEASSTTSIKVMQKGRFVTGPGPAVPMLATYRDTMLSVLQGYHWRLSRSGRAIEPKAGFSLLLGTARRGNDEAGGTAAVTAGVDGVVPINTRVTFMPSFRYSYAFRGETGLYFGLTSHIVKAGFGLRFRIRPS